MSASNAKSKGAAGPRAVLVTGASRGIGLELVRRFKQQGWKVGACSATEKIRAVGEADFADVCDVSRADQAREWVARAAEKLGRVDAVICCAGLAGSNPMEPGSSDELWHRIIDVNLHGTYTVCKAAAPLLPDGSGRVITIASTLGLRGVPDQTAYCAAKHGVIGFTRALALQLAPRRITVNAICPGWTRTEMASGRLRELGLTEQFIQESVPLGRFIEPGEVAGLALYLASAEAGGITGQALAIDGGALA